MLRFRDAFNTQGAHRPEIVYSKCKVSAGRYTHPQVYRRTNRA